MGKVLIIDDDKLFCDTMASLAEQIGHNASKSYNLEQGLKRAVSDDYDVVLLDVQLPDGNGLDLLPKLKQIVSPPEVIIMTGDTEPDGAELAIRTGALDYIEKTASTKKMMLPLIRAMQYREQRTRQKSTIALNRFGIVGDSAPLKDCLDLVAKAATTESNVLIMGETGTGKELFSRAIHENSTRSEERFVVVDCAAMTETLVESMLFGHKKGAFTSADKDQEGLIKHADKGTLFLDEVGELPLSIQKSFLRVLQEHSFRLVGSKQETKSDFRLIAATNRDLYQSVKSGQFREDLLFRLNTVTISLPPLRKRSEDIKDIAVLYISKFCGRQRTETKGVSSEFFEALMSYNWPGNVRELINAIETAILVANQEHMLMPVHLPTEIRIHMARSSVTKKRPEKQHPEAHVSTAGPKPYREVMEKTENKYCKDLISFTQGNITEATRIAGMSRSRLYALLKKHNISRQY